MSDSDKKFNIVIPDKMNKFTHDIFGPASEKQAF